MALPRPAKPSVLLADLRAFFGDGQRRFFGEGQRHKLVFAALSIGITSLVVTGFIVESHSGILPGRQIIMVSDWPATRSDAEIIAQQKIDEKIRQQAKEAKRREFQRADEALKRLGI